GPPPRHGRGGWGASAPKIRRHLGSLIYAVVSALRRAGHPVLGALVAPPLPLAAGGARRRRGGRHGRLRPGRWRRRRWKRWEDGRRPAGPGALAARCAAAAHRSRSAAAALLRRLLLRLLHRHGRAGPR